jgi:hypothetical protein
MSFQLFMTVCASITESNASTEDTSSPNVRVRLRVSGLIRNGPDSLSAEAGRRQHAAEDPGVDRHSGRREAPAREHLRQQAPGRVTQYGRSLVHGIDDLGGVVGDLRQRLLGQDVRVRAGLLDGLRIVRPVRGERRVASLAEELPPAVPAARQQPEAVDEDHRRVAGGVGRLDLLVFPLG